MTHRPQPERRYLDVDLQAAYETAWHQGYDHDSFRTLDWIKVIVDDERDPAARCERRAAMLEGCAAALLELAERQHEGAAIARDLGGDAA